MLFNSIAGLPAPFAPIHLLFINLLTDSLPAIALGLEPHTDSVMKRKPRPANESLMTKPFLFGVCYSGVIIAAATIAAYIIGSRTAGSPLGMTMAFATLCMSRLFHGFSAKADEPVIFTKRMFNNKFGIGAFAAGMLLVNAVLLIPSLHKLFSVSDALHGAQIGIIYALSFGSMCVVQIAKAIIQAVKKN